MVNLLLLQHRYDTLNTPYLKHFETGNLDILELHQYCLCFDFNLESFTLIAKGSNRPSSEASTHAALYQVNRGREIKNLTKFSGFNRKCVVYISRTK